MFREVDAKMNLPKVEEEILDFWDTNKIFEKSIEIRNGAPLYSFYDGPPFATGTPHYGHIVGSVMKDVVPRFWTMQGYQVPRVWGWDCHGLPIENIAEKELGIKQKKDIEALGVKKFNDVCRTKIAGYTKEWEIAIRRLGRWVDMKNSYKTMDLSYMESVWWVFKQLWDRGLIYEGYRSMHVCPRCETTLSQSEVTEGYKDVKDLSVTTKYELIDEPDTFILAWTTTPWTLIGNVALAVGRDIDYIKVRITDTEKQTAADYILADEKAEEILKDRDYEVIERMKGIDLMGRAYRPLFDYYAKQENLENRQNGWKIYEAPFVTTDEGVGIVHIAPAFGEDDMNLSKREHLPFIQHVGMDGVIKPEAGEFAGMHVKPIDDVQKTDVEIIKYLASNNLLFSKEKYEHSYPHCWRCDTPLLNYATSSWFVAVTKIKDRFLELAKEINWSPGHIKHGRFGKWLEGARDWSISRQRFWASVIPIWRCDKCNETKVLGSIADLEEASGQKVTDLHKDVVDEITFNCAKCQGTMKRVPDVLDCWFESGSMPYGQIHYPFENFEQFEKSFPADYIAEGPDQTRAWFYYLHVLSTAIKDSIAFKNVIVNGIVLAEDGKKMSKRLQNYPDPTAMFDKYGADVMRFYLMSSPVVMAENLNFKESEMAELHRGMFRMLWNSYSFFVLYANIDEWKASPGQGRRAESGKLKAGDGNVLDRWILSELNTLIEQIDDSMKRYDLMRTARLFPPFIDNLSNWYIRRSRKRFWKSENDGDKNQAYHTLYEIIVTLSKLMAPFTPFISEEIYKNLTGEESVHLVNFPEADQSIIDGKLTEQMQQVRSNVESALSWRAKAGMKIRQPLEYYEYVGDKLSPEFEDILKDEINVEETRWAKVEKLNTNVTERLKLKGYARELIRNIQSLRKESGFKVEDRIEVNYQTESEVMENVMREASVLISREVLATTIENKRGAVEGEREYSIDTEKIWIGIKKLMSK